jgi:hypothetical protein
MSAISFAPPDSRQGLLLKSAEARTGLRGGLVVDVSVAAFVTTMLVLMVKMPGQETIPYHFLFLALTLVYGFRVWSVLFDGRGDTPGHLLDWLCSGEPLSRWCDRRPGAV